MPRTLDKTRKQITKKKGPLGTLHEGSRDSRRLHKALVRDVRLDKLASTRRKHERPLVARAAFFQERVRAMMNVEKKTASVDETLEVARSFVQLDNDEMAELKRARRPGRPASTREDLLKNKMDSLAKELQKGFFVPDLASEDNVAALQKWEGSWSQLAGLRWVRITEAGVVRPATFPPSKE